MLLSVVLLIVFDQLSKVIMTTFFQEIDLELLNNGFLGLKVYLNEDELSMFNSKFFDFDLSLFFLASLALFMSLFLISVYLFMKEEGLLTFGYEVILALYIAASMSSTIDRVFWGGSLDFILVAGWIVDFKDIYLSFGFILLIFYVLKDLDLESNWRDDLKLAKQYFKFLGTRYQQIFNK